MQPLREKVHVALESSPEATGSIVRPQSTTHIRRVRVLTIGPEVQGIEVGKLYLANILHGQEFGDDLILPKDALLAEWHED